MQKFLLFSLLIAVLTANKLSCGPNMHLIEDMDYCACDTGYHMHNAQCQLIKDLYFQDSVCLNLPSVNNTTSRMSFDFSIMPLNQSKSTFLRKSGVFELNIIDMMMIEVILFTEDEEFTTLIPFVLLPEFHNFFRITFDFANQNIEHQVYFFYFLPTVTTYFGDMSKVKWNDNQFEICSESIRKFTVWNTDVPVVYMLYDL